MLQITARGDMEKTNCNELNPELPDYRSKCSLWSAHKQADEGYTQQLLAHDALQRRLHLQADLTRGIMIEIGLHIGNVFTFRLSATKYPWLFKAC